MSASTLPEPGLAVREAAKPAGTPHAPIARRRVPRAIAATAILLAVTSVAGGAALWWDDARHFETTDDAFLDARQFPVAPKVAGYVAELDVTDNQHVAAGQVIARLDDRDYRVALAQAEAQLRVAQAGIGNVEAEIAAQEAQIAEAEAGVGQAQAALRFAQQDAQRYADLAQRGAGSVQQAQQSASNLLQQQANLAHAQAAVAAARAQLGALRAQRESAAASVAQAAAGRDAAALNLSYTAIVAAQPGRVVRLAGAVGLYAQPGAAIATLVPDEVWVTANFKETQLAHMRPGQAVTFSIDAYPGRSLSGHVESVQPGSGAAFALLPAQNATGNYVKVVQRVPVKLVMDQPPADLPLGPGMSVVPTVRVDPAPSWRERLEAVR